MYGVCWMLQGAANAYILVFFSLFVGAWVLWFVVVQRRWRDLAMIAAATVVAALPLAPILYRYVTVHDRLGLSRRLDEILAFSADMGGVLCAPGSLTFWGWLRVGCRPEGELFPGVALVALCGLGAAMAWRRRTPRGNTTDPGVQRMFRRIVLAAAFVFLCSAISVAVFGPWRFDGGLLRISSSSSAREFTRAMLLLVIVVALSPRFRAVARSGSVLAFYALAGCAAWILSWSPLPQLLGMPVLDRAPYGWLMQLPGIDQLRVPSRFWMMSIVCLVVVMGMLMAHILSRRSRRAAFPIVIAAALGLLSDGWTVIAVADAPAGIPNPGVAREGGTVMMLLVGKQGHDFGAAFNAVTGGWRSASGHTGFVPAYYPGLGVASLAEDELLFDPFRRIGDVHIVVDEDAGGLRAFVERQPGALLTGRSQGRLQFRLPAAERTIDTDALGSRIAPRSLTASCSSELLDYVTDGDLQTRWRCGPQRADQQLTVDLGRGGLVGAIVPALGVFNMDFPHDLIVDTSTDGVSWQEARRGGVLAEFMAGAVEDGRALRIVLPFPPRPARYVRLRQVGRDDTFSWSIAELEVWTGEADASR